MSKKVVIIGGGFGGLAAAKALNRKDIEVTLIDKTNHHLFQPLLYQVATAALQPGDIAAPIRAILADQKNTRVIMGEVTDVNMDKKLVHVNEEDVAYDYLIMAIGAQSSYFGHPEWEEHSIGLKTILDAIKIRETILLSFEEAEIGGDDVQTQANMTVVVVGGGSSGVEVAGAVAEISEHLMEKDFRRISCCKPQVILLEAADRILPAFSHDLSQKAKESLEHLGVEVRLNTMVTNITEEGVWTGDTLIRTSNVVWVAGTQAAGLTSVLDTEKDRAGRIIVNGDCSVKEHPDVFVIGDAALFDDGDYRLPAVAPVATQQGRYVAGIIKDDEPGKERKPFKYFNKGNLAVIGRAKAVLQVSNIKASGFPAWFIWAFVHILVLIEFRNRYRVMVEWIWYYITKRPGIGLITGFINRKSKAKTKVS